MKRNILITLLTLFTITLFGEDVKVQAESQSYKHDKNTLFGIKEGDKYHIFKNNEKLSYLGYLAFDGEHQTVEQTRELEEENAKHISDAYFFIKDDGYYSLYYKDYMGEAKFLVRDVLKDYKGDPDAEESVALGGTLTKEPKLADAATSLEYADDYKTSDPEPELKEDSDDEEDDSGGGLAWYWWALIIWFLLGGSISSKS